MTDFTGALLFREQGPELFVAKQFVRAGMKLIQINRLDAQRLERGLQLRLHAGHGKVIRAVHEAVEVMAELGGDYPF